MYCIEQTIKNARLKFAAPKCRANAGQVPFLMHKRSVSFILVLIFVSSTMIMTLLLFCNIKHRHRLHSATDSRPKS